MRLQLTDIQIQNLLGNTEEEFFFLKHSKTNYLLLEREEKQSQEINKGRAQLTIMKWNKVQKLTYMSKDSRNN